MKLHQGLAAILIGCVCWYLSQCNHADPISPQAEKSTEVSIQFTLPKAANSNSSITRAIMVVTAANMDTIRKELVTASAGSFRDTLRVPSGKDRTFQVTLYQNTFAALKGEQTIDLPAGKRIELRLKLQFLLPALSLSPIDTTVAKNGLFTLKILAHRVDSLCTIGSKILFDPSKLQVVDMGRDDDFLKTNGGTIAQLQFSKNNATGEIKLVFGIFPAAKSVSGDGQIAHVVFKALNGSTTEIIPSLDNSVDPDLGLYDKSANLMNAVALGSKITIQ